MTQLLAELLRKELSHVIFIAREFQASRLPLAFFRPYSEVVDAKPGPLKIGFDGGLGPLTLELHQTDVVHVQTHIVIVQRGKVSGVVSCELLCEDRVLLSSYRLYF